MSYLSVSWLSPGFLFCCKTFEIDGQAWSSKFMHNAYYFFFKKSFMNFKLFNWNRLLLPLQLSTLSEVLTWQSANPAFSHPRGLEHTGKSSERPQRLTHLRPVGSAWPQQWQRHRAEFLWKHLHCVSSDGKTSLKKRTPSFPVQPAGTQASRTAHLRGAHFRAQRALPKFPGNWN